jgi:acyl-coenzyme A thioesterase PaaI-like protein
VSELPTGAVAEPSLQERLFPDLPCFGCGPRNEKGLRLRSYPADGGRVVARFTPWPEHDNGLGFLNGGIIATLLDCHSAAAVTHAAYARGWGALPGAALPHVTAGLDVRYLRPAPLHETVTLHAVIEQATEPEITARVWLEYDGKVRAEATALWKRWRPRT